LKKAEHNSVNLNGYKIVKTCQEYKTLAHPVYLTIKKTNRLAGLCTFCVEPY